MGQCHYSPKFHALVLPTVLSLKRTSKIACKKVAAISLRSAATNCSAVAPGTVVPCGEVRSHPVLILHPNFTVAHSGTEGDSTLCVLAREITKRSNAANFVAGSAMPATHKEESKEREVVVVVVRDFGSQLRNSPLRPSAVACRTHTRQCLASLSPHCQLRTKSM